MCAARSPISSRTPCDATREPAALLEHATLAQAAAPATAAAAGGAGLGLAPWPQVDFAKFGPIETQPLSRIRKLSKANLARNWVMIPHVTQHDEADITEL